MYEQSRTNEESPLNPLDSAHFVIERAKNVSIDKSKIGHLSKIITDALMRGESFNDDDQWIQSDIGPPKENIEKAIDWIFFVSTLNFSFWIDEKFVTEQYDSYTRVYKNKKYHGYEALCASINHALDNGIDLIDAQFYSSISMKQIEEIFNSPNNQCPLPMLEERYDVLHQTGSILIQEYGGHFINCVKENGNSAIDLVQLVVKKFPSYRDETFYDGQKVSFYKRAQILVADIWGCFKGHGLAHFLDMDHLTMFADYRVPQVLAHEGILVYSSALKKRLDKKDVMAYGDEDEVEIRAGSILAVHLIVNQVNEMIPFERDIGDEGQRITAALVDVFLWRRRREHKEIYDQTPFHRTRSIFY